MMPCFSQYVLLGGTVLVCPITGDVNFEHLVTVLSPLCLSTVKLIFFPLMGMFRDYVNLLFLLRLSLLLPPISDSYLNQLLLLWLPNSDFFPQFHQSSYLAF